MLENEKEIVIEWKKGNKKAYEALVRHYMADAFMVAYGYVHDEEDARDLSQDAFVKAYQARESFDAVRPFYPWLYRIIKNHCLNYLKRVSRGGGSLYHDNDLDRERFVAAEPTPLQQLEREERKAIVRAAIELLSEDHREIIVLKNFDGCSYAQIAEMLDIPIGTVMSRLYYARRQLKELIERIEVEGIPETGGCLSHGRPAGEVI